VVGPHLFIAPGQNDAKPPSLPGTAYEVGEQIQGRGVGPVYVVYIEDPRCWTIEDGEQYLADTLEEAALGARGVEQRGGGKSWPQLGEIRQQARGFCKEVGWDTAETRCGAFPADGGREPLDEGAVGEIHLPRITARRDANGALSGCIGNELLSKPGLADTCLSLENDDVPPGLGGPVGSKQRPPLFFAPNQWFIV